MTSPASEPLPEPLPGLVPAPLLAHWATWTGASPEQLARLGSTSYGGPTVTVVGSAARTCPGWDGAVHAVTGVVDPHGRAVVSVPPEHAAWARGLVAGGASLPDLQAALPGRLGLPTHVVYRGVCRWAIDVPPASVLPDVGVWVPTNDPSVPEWLTPFNGEVLMVLDEGDYVAGVGLKVHDEHGVEISVGTSEAARGRGLGRRLVAQAARSLLARGIVATYLHAPDNVASGKVADATGFPDHGWTALGLFDPTSS